MGSTPSGGHIGALRAGLAGRYDIERGLGAGGMAVVYLAGDLQHDRRVALKVLREELGAAGAAERFHREIRLAARLVHPHILPLLDSGGTDGRLWYTMPFIEGESLRARLDREKLLPLDEAIRLTREIPHGQTPAAVPGPRPHGARPAMIARQAPSRPVGPMHDLVELSMRQLRPVTSLRVGATIILLLAGILPASAQTGPSPAEQRAALIARGKSLELPGEWTPPPGIALNHHTAGFAKTLCSAVFLTGLDPKDAAANVGFFTGPLAHRSAVVDTVVDRARREVRLRLPSGVTRVARVFGSQGCVALPIGQDSVSFAPSVVTPNLPDAATTPWPMGDVIRPEPWPAGVDSAAVAAAIDAGFGPPEAMTLAVVVTYKGRIIGERYAPDIGIHTPLESWSMGKSLTGTLVARLIMEGVYTLEQPAPIPEWQRPGDPRREIRIMDIMRMSSGIRIKAPQDPDWADSLGYPDHLYLYTGTVNSFQYAATRPQQWKPNTVGRYRNTDPVLASYLVRLGAEKLKQEYHAFPQRVLFDKIGIRNAIIETDPYGNFLGQGYEMVAARDWARLGNLYLQDGVWNGERLLPAGYVDYVRTLAPAWVADGRRQYGGGFFWVNGEGNTPIPRDAFSMEGAGGQSATIIPSHGLVVVRLGRYRGASAGGRALDQMFEMLIKAVPAED